MPKSRSDQDETYIFRRVDGEWTTFTVVFNEITDDEVLEPTVVERDETYNIADLATQVKTDLLTARAGMIAHRDSMTPIT